MDKYILFMLDAAHKRYARLILMFPIQLLNELYKDSTHEYILIEDGKAVDVVAY